MVPFDAHAESGLLGCCVLGAYDDVVAEHVIPRGRGGQTDMDNLRIACRPDNALKGSMSLETFRKKYGGPNAH